MFFVLETFKNIKFEKEVKQKLLHLSEEWRRVWVLLICSLERQSSPSVNIRVCIQKFPDWPPGARTANNPSFCH